MQTENFLTFVAERERIRLKKDAGQPWPWTDDPILRGYKFCHLCVVAGQPQPTIGQEKNLSPIFPTTMS